MAKRKRLLWQLYPSYLLITFLSLMAATWFASRTLRQFFLEQSASDLEARARLFETQIAGFLSPLDEKAIDQLCKGVGSSPVTRITVILPSGEVIGDSEQDPAKMDNHANRPEVRQALTGGVGISSRYSRTIRRDMMYVGIPLKKDSEIIGVVRTSVPLTSVDKAIQEIQWKIAVGGLIIAGFAAIIGLLVSRHIKRPIEEIKRGIESFARGDFHYKVPISNSEEIGSLAETLNQMASEVNERINNMIRQQNELEAVLSSMVEGVIAVDKEEHVISLNHAAAQMFEIKLSEAQGRSVQEVIRNVDLQKFVTRTLSSEEPLEKDIVIYSDGEGILSGRGTVLHDEGGNRIGGLIVLNDVTRLRRLENVRRDFVANVSHEIKTPLTAIKGFVETLQDGAISSPEDTKRFLGIVERHVERLNAIIEDLLSLSRIEKEVEREEIILRESPVRDVLVTAIQLCEAKANKKNITVELSCNEDLIVKINSALLEQAVVNLLDNAVKYSNEEDVIRVKARQTDGEVVISVLDQGCGIERHHLARIFERFYRVDKARSRKLGGTGLGLAIVKHITQAHGGHVTVESTPGKGSTFHLHLPK